jgi:hypothetical protein
LDNEGTLYAFSLPCINQLIIYPISLIIGTPQAKNRFLLENPIIPAISCRNLPSNGDLFMPHRFGNLEDMELAEPDLSWNP